MFQSPNTLPRHRPLTDHFSPDPNLTLNARRHHLLNPERVSRTALNACSHIKPNPLQPTCPTFSSASALSFGHASMPISTSQPSFTRSAILRWITEITTRDT